MALRNGILFGLAIAFTGCATAPSEEVDQAAANTLEKYERTGETTNCLNLASITSIRPVTEKTFLVQVGAGEYFVNDVAGRCNGATRNSTRLEYTTSLSQLCRNELIKVVDNSTGVQVGGCGLGSYEKLEKKPEAGAEE